VARFTIAALGASGSVGVFAPRLVEVMVKPRVPVRTNIVSMVPFQKASSPSPLTCSLHVGLVEELVDKELMALVRSGGVDTVGGGATGLCLRLAHRGRDI